VSAGRLVLALALALVLRAAPAPAAEVDKFLPNDSEAVTTVNFRQILDSPLVKKYGLEPLQQAIKSNDEVQKILDSLGLDPLKDIDSLTSSSPGGTDADKKGLLILHGRFNLDKIQATAEKVAKDKPDSLKIRKAGDYTLYEATMAPPGQGEKQTFFVALIDKNTLAASPSQDYAVDALDKANGKKTTMLKNKEVQQLIEKADAKQSLWIAALSHGLAVGQLAQDEKFKEILDKVKTLSGGITVSDDVKAEFLIVAKDADKAKEVAGAIDEGLGKVKFFVSLLAMNKKELAPAITALETVKVNAKGSDITVKGEISKDVIEKAVNRGQ
jgi:hypothetical protein